MLSPSQEDYLEEIYRFLLSNNQVRATDISHKLNVSLPSVTKALRKLRAAEYINYQRYGLIGLTEKGKQLGSFLVSRNSLLQEFLTLLRSDCNIAAEAEAMEHYLSRQTIDSIHLLVNFMKDNPEVYHAFLDYVSTQHFEP